MILISNVIFYIFLKKKIFKRFYDYIDNMLFLNKPPKEMHCI